MLRVLSSTWHLTTRIGCANNEGHEVGHEGREGGRVRRWLTSGVCCLAVAAATVEGQVAPSTFTTERVFGPEVATGPYKHPACLTDLANGDLYLVYYGGQGEYARDTAVFGSRRARGSATWTPPQVIARDPFRSLGNGVVWQAPDGMVWLFYVVRYGATWSTSRIQAKISRDNAVTWSDAFMLHEGEGMMVRNRPIVLHDGDYLLPIYHEVGDDPETVGAASTSLFLRYQRSTGQWKKAGAIRSPRGAIQPAVVEVAPKHLIAYNRRGGGYGPDHGWLACAGRVNRWRRDVDAGPRLDVSEPERGGGFPEVEERQPAARLQRHHDRAHAACGRAVNRWGQELPPSTHASPRAPATSRIRLPSKPPMAASMSCTPPRVDV